MTPEEMANSMIKNIEAKTGNTLEHWKSIAAQSGLEKHGQIVKMLKADHGMTHGFANLVAHKYLKSDSGSASPDTDLVAIQYSKGKEALKPIYDEIVNRIGSFGPDLELAPKKAYVSLRRKKQFGIIQPSTKTRVDVGINLKGEDAGERLEASGSWNTMVSHRVRLSDVSDVDDQLISWLKAAFDRS